MLGVDPKNPDNYGEFKTVLGTYSENCIIDDERDLHPCITFGRVNREIEGKYGMFSLVYFIPFEKYLLYNYMIVVE